MKKIATFFSLFLALTCWSQTTVTTNSKHTGIPTDPGSINGIVQGDGSGTTSAITIGSGLTYSSGTLSSSGGSGRTPLAADTTLYVRTPAHAVTFTNASANVGWTTHGLSINDPVVLSILPNMASATLTIANPGIVHQVAHGKVANQPFQFHTTGALPTGAPLATDVYVKTVVDADNYSFSLTPGGAAVVTTGTQSGTHYTASSGAMPTFSTAGLLTQGTPYYVKTVVDANTITLSTTAGGTALGTATVATGAPIYSGSTGNNSNDGTANDRAHAKLTMQSAIDVMADTWDFVGNQSVQATIQVANSVYRESPILKGLVGLPSYYHLDSGTVSYQRVNLTGNETTPSNVRVIPTQTGLDLFTFNASGEGSAWLVSGFRVDATGTNSFQAFTSGGNAYLQLGQVEVVGGTGTLFSYALDGGLIRTSTNAKLRLIGNFDTALYAQFSGNIDAELDTIDLLDAPVLGTAFAGGAQSGTITVYVYTAVNGTATGPKLALSGKSSVVTYGQGTAGFPGSTAGTVDFSSSVDGQLGATATNDNAAAGFAGEYVSSCLAAASAITLSNGTAADVRSLALSAGDWDVEGNINFSDTTATVTGGSGGINTASATLPTDGSEVYDGTLTTALSDTSSITIPRKRVSLASSGTAYLSASKSFSAGTVKAFGCITARRPR